MEQEINSAITNRVSEVMDESEFIIETLFDKCTMVACKLPNGYVIVENSVCADQDEYDEELGAEACMERIFDKIWEMESYHLQSALTDEDEDIYTDDDDCSGDCEHCSYLESCLEENDNRYNEAYNDVCAMIDEIDDVIDDIYARYHIHRGFLF